MTPELKGFILAASIKIAIVFGLVNLGVIFVIWAERRFSAMLQDRLGPNRCGPEGLLQSFADGIKNFTKEETYPAEADRIIFVLAPILSFIPAMLAAAVIPFAAPFPGFEFSVPILGSFVYNGEIPMMIADLPIGFLFILAITSLGVYGIVMAGWSSNNKYAFLGSLRGSAQMVSYEIAMGMGLIALMILVGNVTLTETIARQQESTWFILPLFIGFFLFAVSSLAETNRLPFDLPETESELVTGFHTEYSSMKFSLFFMAEYANMITASAMMATLFFGGWDIPFTTWDEGEASYLKFALTFAAFLIKTWMFMLTFIWIRWTLPRFRFDQLMQLGWKFMIPLALGYIMLIATTVWALDAKGVEFGIVYALILFAVNLPLTYVLFSVLDRGKVLGGSQRRKVKVSA
jgi:NADH-quinone oxidoreductase subunit H